MNRLSFWLGLWGLTLIVGGCVTPGTGGTAVSGSAAGGTSVGASSSLERCTETLGTIAVDDGRAANWYGPLVAQPALLRLNPLFG